MDPSPYAEQRYKDGLECAKRAVQYDQEGHFSGALSFYSEAVAALNHACSMSPAFLPIQSQVPEYSRRADELSRYLKSNRPPQSGCLWIRTPVEPCPNKVVLISGVYLHTSLCPYSV